METITKEVNRKWALSTTCYICRKLACIRDTETCHLLCMTCAINILHWDSLIKNQDGYLLYTHKRKLLTRGLTLSEVCQLLGYLWELSDKKILVPIVSKPQHTLIEFPTSGELETKKLNCYRLSSFNLNKELMVIYEGSTKMIWEWLHNTNKRCQK